MYKIQDADDLKEAVRALKRMLRDGEIERAKLFLEELEADVQKIDRIKRECW